MFQDCVFTSTFSIYFSIKLCFLQIRDEVDSRFIYAIPFYLAEGKFNLVLPEGAPCEPSHPLFNVVGFFARKHKRAILLQIISFLLWKGLFLYSVLFYVG